MKLAIIGSRNIDPEIEELQKHIPKNVTEIVSGGARGVDSKAEQLAEKMNLGLTVIRPDYKRYGRGAPLRRNKQIVEAADCVLALWDGKSRGTQNTVNWAKKLGKACEVIIWKSSS